MGYHFTSEAEGRQLWHSLWYEEPSVGWSKIDPANFYFNYFYSKFNHNLIADTTACNQHCEYLEDIEIKRVNKIFQQFSYWEIYKRILVNMTLHFI